MDSNIKNALERKRKERNKGGRERGTFLFIFWIWGRT